jgi:hypothetical protein
MLLIDVYLSDYKVPLFICIHFPLSYSIYYFVFVWFHSHKTLTTAWELGNCNPVRRNEIIPGQLQETSSEHVFIHAKWGASKNMMT